MEYKKPFRILCLDGGGIRGIYTAQILKRIEEEEGIIFSEYFDLIAGTSTGAILAAALATNKDISQVIDLYKQHGKDIFSTKLPRFLNKGFFTRKYSQKIFKQQLNNIFGDSTMQNTNNLMIFSTDIANGSPFVIKSPYNENFVRDGKIKISEAVLASTAAPVYFNPVKIDKYLLVDGGIWCNNPSSCAIAEARKYFAQDLNNIHLLSIGTIQGAKYFPIRRSNNSILNKFWGFASAWREGLIEMLLNLQSISSENTSDFLQIANYLRVNSKKSHNIPMDDAKYIDDFVSLADQEYTYRRKEIAEFFKGAKHDN